MCATTWYLPGASDAATYWPAASVTAVRSRPVAVARMVMVTPGITAFWLSVMVPCRVAVDCAQAGVRVPTRTATKIANRIVFLLTRGSSTLAFACVWILQKNYKEKKKPPFSGRLFGFLD